MTGPEAVSAVLTVVARIAREQINARENGIEVWGEPLEVARRAEETPEFRALHALLPSDELSEGLERLGVYEDPLKGRTSPRPDACWHYLTRHVDQPRRHLTALEVWGAEGHRFREPVDLSLGFFLRRFSDDETAGWLPPTKYEPFDPHVASQYWFITKEGRGLLDRHQLYTPAGPPRYARDPFWKEWWLPFLCLSLFRGQFMTRGVRIEVAPGWSIDQVGNFDGDLVEDEQGRPCWIRFDSQSFKLQENEQADLEEFARVVIPAATQWAADKDEGPRFQAIGRSFLRAVWSLPDERAQNHDLDRIEECLFGLVRAADGALHGEPPKGALTRKFLDRFVTCAELPEEDRPLLACAYQQRSGLAHAYDSPEISAETARLLWPRVRKCLLGYIGLLSTLESRAAVIEHLNAKSPQKDLSRKLWGLARLIST